MTKPLIGIIVFALLVIVLPTSPLDLVIIPFIIAQIGFGGYLILCAALATAVMCFV